MRMKMRMRMRMRMKMKMKMSMAMSIKINRKIFLQQYMKMSYYLFNRQEILQKAKERNSKEKAALLFTK